MNSQQLLDQILAILSQAREDKAKLQKILNFLEQEIYADIDETTIVPEKYRNTVKEIAENNDCGLISYLNPVTLEIESVPKNLDYPEEYELMTGENYNETFRHETWNRCISFEPPESRISFKIMEHFANNIKDNELKDKLIGILSRKRPFTNFKHAVETSKHRQAWFDFKQQQLEQMVWDELKIQL